MEEVDEIVLHTLRQVGCDLDEINSLREFTTENAIEGVVRCLKLVNPSLELSHHVPPNMSARYRLGSELATICTEMGYKGEIGYQTFLYSNETDLRRIFLFLFEKLPKESEKALDEPLDKTALIIKETQSYFSRCLNMPWLPNYCKINSISNTFLLNNPSFSVKLYRPISLFLPSNYKSVKTKSATTQYFKNNLQSLPQQAKPGPELISSLFETNALDYVKESLQEWNQDDLNITLNRKEISAQKKTKIAKLIDDYLLQALQKKEIQEGMREMLSKNYNVPESHGSRFTHSLQLQFTSDKKENFIVEGDSPAMKNDTEEEKQKKRETEIKSLQEQLDSLLQKTESLILENKNFEASSQNIEDLIKKEQETLDNIKEQYRVKKCTLSLLPDADANIKKLQTLIDASSQRLVVLANQWEQHRVPLIDEYRELRELSSKRVSETQRKLEEIKVLREKIKNLGIEARQKEDMHKHLIAAYERLTKDVSRSAYTRRIMEIVGNIKKQKSEIDKVLLDTRNVQKEINRLSGKLERTFTVTDELIFKDAKKDEAIRRAYKYVASLHENSSALVQIIEETGSIVREIREIEDQIEQENQKKVAANLERITSDYKQMQQENASLIAQLK
ncbi:coiled-coil domain-containing protein 22 homolog [Uloborus diversus]|uniref:coiled-coil domain-containing protein 22 homolog n=1 Tax=Uloborus diversus TaxID=327109 RepID=UPI00240943D4|nr:coiled-coil domain-containing protein 22 homolog [Uloborus diversus]